MIKKEGTTKWVLYSKDGKKRLGTFRTKKAAEEREAEINRIKHAKSEIDLTLKFDASDTNRWYAIASDIGTDNAGEATSVELFESWIDRATNGSDSDWLPEASMPYLSISHYQGFDGIAAAGLADEMDIEDGEFIAQGYFSDTEFGKSLKTALLEEFALIERGDTVDDPIRISAGWWDIKHRHGDKVFERKSLDDVCPMCAAGEGGKVYLAGQLDHIAATRVPMNPRTSLEMKSEIKTKRQDAASIVGDRLADKLEEMSEKGPEQKAMVSKSENPPRVLIEALSDKLATGEEFNLLDALTETIQNLEDSQSIKAAVGDFAQILRAANDATTALAQTHEVTKMNEDTTQAGQNVPALDSELASLIDGSPTRDAALSAVEARLNPYIAGAKAAIDAKFPPDAADLVKSEVAAQIAPIQAQLDQIALMLQKSQGVPAQQPVQKSLQPQTVQPQQKSELAPVNGKFSAAQIGQAMARRYLGGQQ